MAAARTLFAVLACVVGSASSQECDGSEPTAGSNMDSIPGTCTETATTSVSEDKTACDGVTGAALDTATACDALLTKASDDTQDDDGSVTDVKACTYATDFCDGTVANAVCIHTCTPGYVGGSITCTSDGSWSVVDCTGPPLPTLPDQFATKVCRQHSHWDTGKHRCDSFRSGSYNYFADRGEYRQQGLHG